MRYSLALISAPASEPVTLAEAKAWARIDSADDDSQISALITAARQAAEQYLRRSLVTQTWKLSLDLDCSALSNLPEGHYDMPPSAFYGGLPTVVPLPKGPVASITSVVTYGLTNVSSTFSADSYRVDSSGDRMVLNYGASWPSDIRPQAGCEITYVAGYGAASAVPQPIRSGILMHVASLYEQRGQCGDPSSLPPATQQLYSQYRILGDRLG